MAAGTSTCHTCGKEGHYARNCWKNKDRNDDNDSTRAHDNKQKNKKSSGGKDGAKGADGQKWCSVHRTTSHNDEECYEQGAPRPERGGAHLASTTLSAGSPPVIDDDDFDQGFAFSATGSGTRPSPHPHNRFAMLVDSGASDHFIDDELLPGLREGMKEYKTLTEPKPIETADNKKVFATATGTICGHIINQSGEDIPVRISVVVVPGIGRHLLSSARAMKSGVSTILETGNPHLQFNKDTSLLLNQHQKDAGMYSFDVSLRASDNTT